MDDTGGLVNVDVLSAGDCSGVGVCDGDLYRAIIAYTLGWIGICCIEWIVGGLVGW